MITGLLEENDIPCFQRVEGLHGKPALFSARWAPVPGQRYEIVVASASEMEARRLLEETLGPGAGQTTLSPATPSQVPDSPWDAGDAPTRSDPRILVLLVLLGVTLLFTVVSWLLHVIR